MSTKYLKSLALVVGLLFAGSTAAVTYTDNFSSTVSMLNWNALGYACLTAGSGSGTIPACSTPNDVAGSGALRLTPALNSQTGAILSNFTFPLSQGLQVTFTTYTYGGNSGGTAQNGADGIAFFLTDGAFAIPTVAGGQGGSLGYSCSNSNGQYEGIPNAYLGLGIDEYGNFLNSGDNTNTGITNTNVSGVTTNGGNTFQASGQYFYQPERIGLRGAGNLTWAWLQSKNPIYYTGTADAAKTHAACQSDSYVSSTTITTTKGKNGTTTTQLNYTAIPNNYRVIDGGYSVLPNTTLIANETAQTRTAATPITYRLNISSSGLLNFAYSYNNGAFQPVLANNSITASNGPLPASLRFGFSSGTGGSNNVHEITCFSASPLLSNSSAGANTVQSGQVKIGSQIYLATYTADNWWGSVVSDSLNTAADGTLSVSSVSNWDANCDITGGPCPSLGTDAQGNATHSVTAQLPALRILLTSSGIASSGALGGGSAFEWVNGISAAQQTNLNNGDLLGATRLNWLRGVRTNEQLQSPVPGSLRARSQVLGDIIDSSPSFVGAPAPNEYPNAFTDSLLGNTVTKPENASGAQTYAAFVTAYSGRTNIVYAGSNDGFLHGFAAGPPAAADGTYQTAANNGTEVLGFMPAGVLGNPDIVNLTSPTYVHKFFVDATPVASDLFYANAWHTWLVGGVGSGGSELYALDITDPSKFTEANAAALVMGDWSKAGSGLTHLGTTAGTPVVARMHNGNWAVIFGNGLGTTTTAGVYIGIVNSTTGAVTFQFLDTGAPSTASVPNGITYVTSVDLDGDQIADYLYAGDLQGNVWRFDVTGSTSSSWAVSTFQTNPAVATPLYVAKSGTGVRQPITTAAVVSSVTVGGGNRVMVSFGTGQKTPFTSISGDVYATGRHTFYGIWDWDMSAWNVSAISNAKYVALPGSQAVDRSKLLQQLLTSTSNTTGTNSQVLGYRNLPVGSVVCWSGSTTCASSNTQFGWLFDLPTLNEQTNLPSLDEQIIYSPTIIGGAVVVNTAIPAVISASQCNAGRQTGWTMAFDPASGSGIVQSFFPDANGSTATASGSTTGGSGSTTGGIRLDGVGTPTALSYNGQTYLVTQTVPGTPALSKVFPPNNPMSRVSWKEMRH